MDISEDMINIGAYTAGSSVEIDTSIALNKPINDFLCQDVGKPESLMDSFTKMLQLATVAGQSLGQAQAQNPRDDLGQNHG